MLADGQDMFTLSRRPQHETYATTDAWYDHPLPTQQMNAAGSAAAAMGGCALAACTERHQRAHARLLE